MMTEKFLLKSSSTISNRLLIWNRFLDVGDLAILICNGLQKDESLILCRLVDLHHMLLSANINNCKILFFNRIARGEIPCWFGIATRVLALAGLITRGLIIQLVN